jgi:hypothetical protein
MPTVTIDSPKTIPSIAGPTFKFGYKNGVGAFQGWNGGLELPKTIDLGGVRVTRPILRGRKLAQVTTQDISTWGSPLVDFASLTWKGWSSTSVYSGALQILVHRLFSFTAGGAGQWV